MTLNESWDRIPQAKVRIPEWGLKPLLQGLSEGGFCSGYGYTISLVEGGVLVSLSSNVGRHPNTVPYPIDVFIPVPEDQMPRESDAAIGPEMFRDTDGELQNK